MHCPAEQSRCHRTPARAALTLAAAVALAAPGLAQIGSSFEAEFALSRRPSDVVIEYTQDLAALARQDSTPFLRIYGDGRYVVHYPVYMKKAGDWEGRIDSAALDSLMGSLVAARLLDVDLRQVKREIEVADRARGLAARGGQPIEIREVSDGESTRVRVRLERYKPAGVIGEPGRPVDKEIVWWNLRYDARRYPHVAVLQELEAVESQLRALAEAPGLERLVGEVSR